jgi:hypothetical protein
MGKAQCLPRRSTHAHTRAARLVASRVSSTSPSRFARSSRVLERPLIWSIALPRVQRRCPTVQTALGLHQRRLDPRYLRSRSRSREVIGGEDSQEEKGRKGWTFRRTDNLRLWGA